MRLGFLFAALTLLLAPSLAFAQNSPFAPAITVNDKAVTYYEIEQRQRLLATLNMQGDLEKTAREALVNERLQQVAAERSGIAVDEEIIDEAMEEFAGRANMDKEQILRLLARNGVAAETYRDFIKNRTVWRAVVRSRFVASAAVTDAEVDRAMSLAQGSDGAMLLLAEIILPLAPEVAAENRELAVELSRSLRRGASFAETARTFSVSPSADRGGSMGWLPLNRLPQSIVSMMLSMQPGEITEPVELPNALAIFQFRGLREVETQRPRTVAAEYLRVMIPGGNSADARQAAADLEGQLDTCDDFYGYDENYAEGQAERVVLPIEEVPGDIALEIAKLDANEVSTSLTRGEHLMFLMLCGRTTEFAEGNREQVRQQLFVQRLEAQAASLMEQLRADAIIVEK